MYYLFNIYNPSLLNRFTLWNYPFHLPRSMYHFCLLKCSSAVVWFLAKFILRSCYYESKTCTVGCLVPIRTIYMSLYVTLVKWFSRSFWKLLQVRIICYLDVVHAVWTNSSTSWFSLEQHVCLNLKKPVSDPRLRSTTNFVKACLWVKYADGVSQLVAVERKKEIPDSLLLRHASSSHV